MFTYSNKRYNLSRGDFMISLKPFKLKDLELRNKIVMPPMCMYSSDESGFVKDFHKIHYGARALGGVGLIIVEATAIEPRGRISDHDLGIWSDDHIEGLKSLVDLVHGYGCKIGIQLAHAGRKCQAETDFTIAPSPLTHSESYKVPKELTKEEIKTIIGKFKSAAHRADRAGFDLIEIHAAHGYLIHEFLSPLSNIRQDAYGGSLINRTRFLREVASEVKKVWPSNKAISLRVSATDHLPNGLNISDMVEIVNSVKAFVDLVHVSTGGLLPAKIKLFDGYQVEYAKIIRDRCSIATISVGLIQDFDLIEDILINKKSDLVAVGREILRNPQFVLNQLYSNKYRYDFPDQYKLAYRYRSSDTTKTL